MDKTSSTIKRGIHNSTTSKNGNGQRSVRKLGPFQANMGELCSHDGYWEKSSKRTGRHTSFGNQQEMSANIQMSDTYLIKLRHLIKTCEYSALEDEPLRDQIVTGTSNNNVRARLLSESGLALDQVIDICRSTEQAELQLSKLNNSAETIHYTKTDKKRHENS